MNLTIVELAIEDIRRSKTNPRKFFDKAKLAELAESIRAHGVLNPILVRPVSTGYEVVAGERRLRAAKMAGLEEIPANVREMSDRAALEVQVIENLQREDLHPVEEAQGFASLVEKHGYAVEEIAAKVGRSKAYIYARMRLCSLSPSAKRLFLENRMLVSTALLVAGLPQHVQDEAAASVTSRLSEPMAGAEAERVIRDRFMCRLSDARFDKAECQACPKRSGNQPSLFAQLEKDDICTDPACFARKVGTQTKPEPKRRGPDEAKRLRGVIVRIHRITDEPVTLQERVDRIREMTRGEL